MLAEVSHKFLAASQRSVFFDFLAALRAWKVSGWKPCAD